LSRIESMARLTYEGYANLRNICNIHSLVCIMYVVMSVVSSSDRKQNLCRRGHQIHRKQNLGRRGHQKIIIMMVVLSWSSKNDVSVVTATKHHNTANLLEYVPKR
jgi:hypothetical protein